MSCLMVCMLFSSLTLLCLPILFSYLTLPSLYSITLLYLFHTSSPLSHTPLPILFSLFSLTLPSLHSLSPFSIYSIPLLLSLTLLVLSSSPLSHTPLPTLSITIIYIFSLILFPLSPFLS